jgi:hypothetical protein
MTDSYLVVASPARKPDGSKNGWRCEDVYNNQGRTVGWTSVSPSGLRELLSPPHPVSPSPTHLVMFQSTGPGRTMVGAF